MTPMGLDTAGSVMPDVLDDVGDLPLETKRVARVLADVVGMSTWASGKSPRHIATACIYVADYAVRPHDRHTQMSLTDVAPGTHVTLRKNAPEVPTVFFEEASDEDIERLYPPEWDSDEEPEVLQMLRLFQNAHDLGVRLDQIDPWTRSMRDE